MSNFEKRIIETDYKKAAKRFIIILLCIVILGGVLIGVTWHTQIGEAITWHQTIENSDGANHQAEAPVNGQNSIYKDNEGNDKQNSSIQENRDKNEHGDRHEREDAEYFDSAQFTQPTVGAKIVFVVVAVLCVLLGIAYWLLIMAWLYKAAELAAMNGALWAILGLFANLVAVAIFLILRGFMPICPSCGRHQEKASFCRFCGTAMYRKCSECGLPFRTKDAYCPYCGHPADGKSNDRPK